MRVQARIAAAFAFLLGGCVTMPPVGIEPPSGQTANEVGLVVERIVCEIETSSDYATLWRDGYVVAVSLQVNTTDSSGFTPSLSFIHPLHHSTTFNQATSIGGELSGSILHQYSQTFEIHIHDLPPPDPNGRPNF